MFHQLLNFQFKNVGFSSELNRKALAKTRAIVICSIAAFLAFAQPSQANEPCKVLIVGDSLSAAYGLPVEQGWVALMESKMAEKFPECSVVNASVSGETTAGGKSRLPRLLEQHQPSLMVLELGANDGLRGLPIQAMKRNLTDMIKLAKAQQTETILVGMQIPSNYGPKYTRKFKEAFEELSEAYKLPLVPFMLDGFAADPSAFQDDGIHPNAGAQPIILENIWPYVMPLLGG